MSNIQQEKQAEVRLPELAENAVLKHSEPVPEEAVKVSGINYDEKPNASAVDLINGMKNIGFQATNLAKACEIINQMRNWSGPDTKANDTNNTDENHSENHSENQKESEKNADKKCTIFLGFTSNLISSGLRSTIRFLVQHNLVSAIVTTAGGVEEDLIKCLAPTYIGDFSLKGEKLREKGLNRIGNLLVPNDNYCKFEDWIIPIFDQMLKEQEEDKDLSWSPSKVIDRLGKEINNPDSVMYWAHKNKIPVFSPALTDGSIGDMLFFHTFKTSPKQLKIDIVSDIRRINSLAMNAACAGMIILGGGVIKHHIANACLMRNGADFAVYISTAQEFDGSDAGARPDEAVSWGKIKAAANTVKVFADVTLVFPLIVAATFASGDDPNIYSSSNSTKN